MSYRERYHLEPLQIRAYLGSNVIADEYLPLDGILLYQAHRELHGARAYTLPGEYTVNGVSTLPLEITHPGRKLWYYNCSWAQWPSHAVEGLDYWNKRFDNSLASLVDFEGKRGKVIIEQGEYKAYRMPVYYRAALYIDWWCVGDKSEIEHLLATVTHIGKKTAQGWGRVMEWAILSAPADYSIWRDGRLMRGVPPVDAPAHSKQGEYGIRPSYWNHANQMVLALP